jgi:phosphate acetyltransferase
MFEYKLFAYAKKAKKKIVLPEAHDIRILQAAEIILNQEIADIIFLANPQEFKHRYEQLGLDLSKAEVIDHKTPSHINRFAQELYKLRKHKGLRIDQAFDAVTHINYFATMMVHLGMADGMVSGATHSTAETIRPALQIIKTKEDTSLVSSIFFMCLYTKVLVFGDCAIVQNPNANELADIAILANDNAKRFGIEPKVAIISYSSGNSAQGVDVEKAQKAVEIIRKKRDDIIVDGPMQFDTAFDKNVAKKKMPHSKVAGEATVYIFPDLNTGNTTYKAVQRSSGAVAIGPILQGLKKPINDLSRGCLVKDIVNTIAITAIQAQELVQ